MSCKAYVRTYTAEAVMYVIIIGILACFATLSVESWFLVRHPIGITINSVTISPSGDWIVVDAQTEPSGACIRHIQHMLSSEIAGKPTVFVPIGSALNGAKMGGPEGQFTTIMAIPPQIGGLWQYTMQTSYSCPPFGLVQGSFATAPPVPVDLGAMRKGRLH